jgi:UDP:flavonoid glycosyltransferase YjiC (YdhE family)
MEDAMRVLFTVSGWPGHYFPMVALARAFAGAGHQVRVACEPSQQRAIRAAGLPAEPILYGLDMALQARLRNFWDAQDGTWPYPWLPPHPVTGGQLSSLDEFDVAAHRKANREPTLAATRDSFDAAVAMARDWRPHLVLHDRLSAEGLLVSRVLGVPGVLHLWGPVGLGEPGPLRLMPGDHSGSFARYGAGQLGAELVERVIDPCPDDLRPPVLGARRIPARYVPYDGMPAAPLPDWLAAPPRRPRVCLVWGTSLTRMAGPGTFIVPRVLAALAGLDVEVVALVGGADAAGLEAPAGTRVLVDFPLRTVLPGCAAVLHHGGAGCAMTSLSAGVPQVAVTFATEQAANADRIATAGAGLHLPGAEFDPDLLREMVRRLLADPAYQAAADRLRAQCERRPGPAELVAELTAQAAVPA